jgi:hypothetical protein
VRFAQRDWLLIGIIAFAVLAAGTATGAAIYAMSRGLRNNNPGNIKRDGTPWQGMAPQQTDPVFVQFTAPEWGVRAIGKVLQAYFARGLNTVTDIIGTWAPPSENDTGAYVDAVAGDMGVDPNQQLSPSSDMLGLVAAIIRHENGTQPYNQGTLIQGLALA